LAQGMDTSLTRPVPPAVNQQIAAKLRQAADLLAQQEANPYRTAAFRRAADTLDELNRSVADLVEREGPIGLQALPGIGGALAAAILEMIETGRWAQLERLRGAVNPEQLFLTVPGLGPQLARRIHDVLHVDTLEDLEVAAHDGRLETVPGIGTRRLQALRAALAEVLGRVRGRATWWRHSTLPEPPVEVILDVDREYRERSAAGELRTLAPKRFNPHHVAWLPILHTQRGPWHFTALFSNTARAHELGRTKDWVVMYYDDGDHQERQCTVVTETHGALVGRRVVRGREAECRELASRQLNQVAGVYV
jgi:DNA polymerase (family X)